MAAVRAMRAKLLPQQLAVVKSAAQFMAAFCTRQAGKSHVAAQLMGEATLKYPRCVVPYFALTKDQCHDIMWPKLDEWFDAVKVKVHFNEQKMRVTVLHNGSVIRMMGMEKPKEIDKVRGITPPLAVIDEGGTFGTHIEGLVEKALYASLMRHRGRLLLVGTPGEIAQGWFYEVTSGLRPGWDVHKWSFLDNIHLPAEERNLQLIVDRQFGGDWLHPTFRREYLGEWVADAGNKVYDYDPVKNDWDGVLPAGHEWIHGLGVDIGSVDGTAFVVPCFSPTHDTLFLVEELKFKKQRDKHLSVSDIAAHLSRFYEKRVYHRPVCDMGALSAIIVEELNQRWGFALQAADKTHKNDFIEHLNSDLRLGRIKIPAKSQLASEMARLVWDDKLSPSGKRREKPGMPNDLADAFLYSYREAKHWAGKLVQEEAKPSDMAQVEWEHRKALDKKLKELENERQDADWAWS